MKNNNNNNKNHGIPENLSTPDGKKLRPDITYEAWCDEDGFHEQFNKPIRKVEGGSKKTITHIDWENRIVTFEEVDNEKV